MADYSCYIRIKTSASVPTLNTNGGFAATGSYVTNPFPFTINPGSTINFQLQDPDGPVGSQGNIDYQAQKGAFDLSLSYADPYGDNTSNSSSASLSGSGAEGFVLDIWSATGDNNWQRGPVPTSGHPVWFFVGVRKSGEAALTPD